MPLAGKPLLYRAVTCFRHSVEIHVDTYKIGKVMIAYEISAIRAGCDA